MKEIEEKNSYITGFESEKKQLKIKGELSNAMAKLEINSDLPEDVRNNYIDTVFNSLMNGAKVLEDGSIVFYDGETMYINPKTASKATAEEILQSKLKSILLEKKEVTGGGGQGQKAKSKSSISFTNAKTKMELNTLIDESLLLDGVLRGNPEFQTKKDELFKEFSNGLPLR